ncbi:hypothetical protein EKD04_008115 [Chloroflexales bacterium ZM16-3]|nr:hypothetical protein [Chloroflexales bacterium ZM16-3]
MTTTLEAAFSEAAKLAPEDQELFAAWIISELKAEHRWNTLFARSADTLNALADEALREFRAGTTKPLDVD